MYSLKKIELNNTYDNLIKNDDYSHNYSIFLEKNKYYFIELINKNEYEFNLKIFDSNYNKINTNDNINNISSKLIKFSKNESDEEIQTEMDNHNKYIEEKYKEDSSDEDESKSKDNDNLKLVLYQDDTTDNIEIVLELTNEFSDEKDTQSYINAIQNLKKLREYNNKIYLKVKKSENYIINVTSEYENEEGEYSLSIKEVEDISCIIEKNLSLNEEKKLKFKKKYFKEKFVINLDIDTEYVFNYDCNDVKIFILGEGKTYSNSISEEYRIFIRTKLGGKYIIEVISKENDAEVNISLDIFEPKNKFEDESDTLTDTPNDDLNKSIFLDDDSIYYEKLYMRDIETNDKYEIKIKNGQILVEKIIH